MIWRATWFILFILWVYFIFLIIKGLSPQILPVIKFKKLSFLSLYLSYSWNKWQVFQVLMWHWIETKMLIEKYHVVGHKSNWMDILYYREMLVETGWIWVWTLYSVTSGQILCSLRPDTCSLSFEFIKLE